MKKLLLLPILLFTPFLLVAQSLMLTFSPADVSSPVETVLATNMMTGESTSLPGNETLMLEPVSGIYQIHPDINDISLFPNPVHDYSNLLIKKAIPGNMVIEIQSMTGQTINSSEIFLEAGNHNFSISFGMPGVYIINCQSDEFKGSINAVCSQPGTNSSELKYIGTDQDGSIRNSSPKSVNVVSKLSYTPGDVIHYKCFSSQMTTIFTDIPVTSKTYTVQFYECGDESDRNYGIVKIGEQFWMAENLAYLPSVNNQYEESFTEPRYYVYDYEGNLVSEATESNNYLDYGVLYNWEAAMASCPDGWRLATEDEWNTLVNALGQTPGDKLKSSTGWYEDANGNNFSGFNALPAGRRSADVFKDMGRSASFWSSTEDGAFNARGKSLSYIFDAVANLYSGRHMGNSVRCLKD